MHMAENGAIPDMATPIDIPILVPKKVCIVVFLLLVSGLCGLYGLLPLAAKSLM